MTTAQEALNKLLEALNTEKEEERKLHETLLTKAPLVQQIAQGVCWFPCTVLDSGYGMGYYPFVVLERSKNQELNHSFNSGKNVIIFSNTDREENQCKGTIQYIEGNKAKVTFFTDEIPEWLDGKKVGLQLLFDENSYAEMENALRKAITTERGRLAELREIIYGNRQPYFHPIPYYTPSPNLNESQNQAIENILGAEDVAVIHGPPGTGKTTTLIQTILELVKTEKSILVCAGSNSAVDYLTEKLIEKNVNVLRIGNLSRINETLYNHTIEGQFQGSKESKQVKELKRQATEYRNMANKYKRSFGRAEHEQRMLLRKEAKQLVKEAVELENYFQSNIVDDATVITCTLVGSMNRNLFDRTYQTVIIDEAAQCLEPACWIAISKAQRVILAGDPFQLPPTVKSLEASKKGLSVTLLEKLITTLPIVNLLNTQYRMNEVIMGFSNQWFYNNKLIAHENVKYHALDIPNNSIMEFIDTAGCSFDETQHPETLSYYNKGEYDTLVKHLNEIQEACLLAGISPSIGIISPYKQQVIYLKENLPISENITINTIDSFQGQERDIIYISLVRSNEKSEIGFLQDYRRMNVALTRARKKLIVIGDSATLGNNPFYSAFLDYCQQKAEYRTAWEFM